MDRTPGAIHTSERAERSAKRMRREPTYAEAKFWKALRATNLHFRRQAPFGPYIVDFVCHRHRLVVEMDGGVHNLPEVASRDAERDAWLTGRGYRVMRFPNNVTPDDIVQLILGRLGDDTPTPTPPRKGEGL